MLLLCLIITCVKAVAGEVGNDIPALTSKGDQVILHANGHWEFVDTQKAVEAKAIADQYPDNKGCPPGWQGGYLGIGRCIPPGDKDFRRGSMGGK